MESQLTALMMESHIAALMTEPNTINLTMDPYALTLTAEVDDEEEEEDDEDVYVPPENLAMSFSIPPGNEPEGYLTRAEVYDIIINQ